jgi:hypothetical protein
MPRPRLPMRKIRDVLRLSAAGMSKRKIAASLGVSATAAGECIRRARRAGLIWPLPDGLSDEALERQLFPSPAVAAKDRRPQPDWAAIHREQSRLRSRDHKNAAAPGAAASPCARGFRSETRRQCPRGGSSRRSRDLRRVWWLDRERCLWMFSEDRRHGACSPACRGPARRPS